MPSRSESQEYKQYSLYNFQSFIRMLSGIYCATVNKTSRLAFTARLRPQFQTPPVPNAPVRNAPELQSLHAIAIAPLIQSKYPAERPKRRRTVPLRPIWAIMVAAKLDQSRVLVTKFRQNWLTLKARSASPRHTDRQTDKLG